MQIKDFCEMCRKGRLMVSIEFVTGGYHVYAKMPDYDVVYVDSQRAKKRTWKRLDVVVKHLEENGFEGDLNLQISRQQTL